MSEVSRLCSLHVAHRDAVAMVGGLVAEAADALGLGAVERVRLRTLVQEAVEAVVSDSFAGAEELDLDVSIERRPGGMAVVVEDRGAPTRLAQGDYPPRVADLIRLGFADDFSAQRLGRAGNRTEILKRLTYSSLVQDERFAAEAAAEEEVELDADGAPVLDVRPMTPDDVLEVARLFFRVYGYSAYQASDVYEPERLAEYVAAGRHLATVAVTPSGRVVGHLASRVEDPAAVTGKIGLLAVEPAYRRHKIAVRLGWVHVARLVEHGIIGQYSEAVTVHTRSQELALRSGAHEVGIMLAGQTGELDFRGFDGTTRHRRAVLLCYGALGATPPREVHVPQAYVAIAERIYAEAGLPRTLAPRSPRPPHDLPDTSRFRVSLSHESRLARITVEGYGKDFDAALQRQLGELRLNRYELILLQLPLSDPLTSFFGDGLQELGLSFEGVLPEYEDGDVLGLQSLNNVEVDPDEIQLASDFGRELLDLVVADYRKALDGSARRVRSRTAMARFYEALQ